MVKSSAATVQEYLKELSTERRIVIIEVRNLILKNLPAGYVEVMRWGMISYEIPLNVYPKTHNKQPLTYAALASQKNYLAVYLMTIYGSREKQFGEEYKKTGKPLDMGRCCIRFKKVDDLPLTLIAKEIASMPPSKFIKVFEASRKEVLEKRKN